MIEIKKDVAHTIRYTPPKHKTGETVTVEIFDEAGVEIAGSPFTATELVDPVGIYTQAFTPDAKGEWQVVAWYGASSGKIAEVFKVTDNDIDDLATSTDLAAADAKLDIVQERTDNLPDDPASQADTDASIAASESSIKGGSETLESVKDAINDQEEPGRII